MENKCRRKGAIFVLRDYVVRIKPNGAQLQFESVYIRCHVPVWDLNNGFWGECTFYKSLN